MAYTGEWKSITVISIDLHQDFYRKIFAIKVPETPPIPSYCLMKNRAYQLLHASDIYLSPLHRRLGMIGRMKNVIGELTQLLEVLPDAVIAVDTSGQIVFANPAVKKLFGYEVDELVGQALDCLIPDSYRKRHQNQVAKFSSSGQTMLMSSRPVLQALHKSGETIPVSVALAKLNTDGGSYSVAVIRDATPIRDHIGEVLARAEMDALTSLANREALLRRINEIIAKGLPASLLFLDLERFKPFNDLHGHKVGDEVLRIVALRIKALLRADDLAARFGGDEFVVFFKSLNDSQLLESRAIAIAESLRSPFHIESVKGRIGVNIGGAIYPQDGRTGTELIETADRRMYKAKQGGLSYCVGDDVCKAPRK